MADARDLKEFFLERIGEYDRKYELSKTVGPDYYEPGMMENLDQYYGREEPPGIYLVKVDAKGLRYEERTPKLKECKVNDPVKIVRDRENEYNSNNFNIVLSDGFVIGMLPANLCNVVAPLFDMGYLVIDSAKISYIEQLQDRSRYAKQGVLFVEMHIRLRGV